jgi:hypothetical protein
VGGQNAFASLQDAASESASVVRRWMMRWCTLVVYDDPQFGLVHNRLKENDQELTVGNCNIPDIPYVQTNKMCDASNIMYGLGITSLATAGLGLVLAVLAFCMRFKWKVMLPASCMFFLSSLFAGIGGGLYRKDMLGAIPTGSSGSTSISCSVEPGPLALVFIGVIFHFAGCVLFCPLSVCLPSREATPTQDDRSIAFTTMSSDS